MQVTEQVRAEDPIAEAGVPAGPMYIGTSTARASEITLRWSRAGLFITLHTGYLFVGIPLIVRIPGLPKLAIAFLLAVASALAFALAVLWHFANRKAHQWIEFWNVRLRRLEAGPPASAVAIVRDPEFDRIHNHWPTFNAMLSFISGLFMFIWVMILIVAVGWAFLLSAGVMK